MNECSAFRLYMSSTEKRSTEKEQTEKKAQKDTSEARTTDKPTINLKGKKGIKLIEDECEQFKNECSRPGVKVHFVGVW